MRLRLIYRERVGIVSNGLQVPGSPLKQRIFGHYMFLSKLCCNTFATHKNKKPEGIAVVI